MLTEKEKRAIYKKRYNSSEKGKIKNREQAKRFRANTNNRFKQRLWNWKKRGLKYYPENLNEVYESKQNCSFCYKPLKINFMEHNHTTGSFRGFACSSCNTKLGNTDKYFRTLMRELKFIVKLPKLLSNLNIK